ncbi:hypothetical protein H311_00174, partial [Anncaliia algerae PRA109]
MFDTIPLNVNWAVKNLDKLSIYSEKNSYPMLIFILLSKILTSTQILNQWTDDYFNRSRPYFTVGCDYFKTYCFLLQSV